MHWALCTALAVAPMHPTSALRTAIAGSPMLGTRAQRNLCPTGAASQECRPAEPACDGAQLPPLWGGGRGVHWTRGPCWTSDPWGLPRWIESFPLSQAQLGSSLSQPLDLTCRNSAPGLALMTEEMPRFPGPQGVGAGVSSNKPGCQPHPKLLTSVGA